MHSRDWTFMAVAHHCCNLYSRDQNSAQKDLERFLCGVAIVLCFQHKLELCQQRTYFCIRNSQRRTSASPLSCVADTLLLLACHSDLHISAIMTSSKLSHIPIPYLYSFDFYFCHPPLTYHVTRIFISRISQ